MNSFWKNVLAFLSVAGICAAAIAWQVHKARTDERRLAETSKEAMDAARVCRALAEQGDPKAESELAYMYSRGEGVGQSYDEALRWRRKAADQGYAEGEAGLGYMYFHGQGVAQDYGEAIRWYRMAADQGSAKAENSLALMYEQGQGVLQDYGEALRWYRKAADQGYASAEYNLGNMYYYGRGVTQDRAEAVRWYRRAADHGDEYAQQVLHLKWKGLSTFSWIALAVISLGSLLCLVASLLERGKTRKEQQRTFAIIGLLGLSYAVLDLVEFRYVGILTPIWAIAAFQLLKGVSAGISVLLLLSIVFPKKISVKITRVGLGVVGVVFVGINLLPILTPKTRSFVPILRPLWSINGMFLGTLVALAIYLWLEFQRDKVSSK
jgi:TPR repeat protein